MAKTFAICFTLFCCEILILVHVTTALNNRPVIGVLAQESLERYRVIGGSYIYSHYVEFLKAGGARVVPVRINQPLEYYENIFKSINGVLFPGGAVSLESSGYAKAGKLLFKLALKANLAGDYFPVLGVCLGFELLTVLVAGSNLLTPVDATNLPLPLDLARGYRQSKIYGCAPENIIEILQHENVTDNDHKYGIKPKMFTRNKMLGRFFKVLSTNKGRNGKKFVSTIEARGVPVWGLQFHPEQTYNWNPLFPWLHNSHALHVTQYFANFFVDQARKSTHKFPDIDLEVNAMIENYPTIYVKNSSRDRFESIYVFNAEPTDTEP